jgi:hypothetical protein
VDLRAPQCFVDVDVPEPGHRSLIEERSLDRGAAAFELPTEPSRRERSLERLDPESVIEVRLEFAGLEQLPGAEAAHVAVRNIRTVVQSDNSTSMRVVTKLALRRVPQASRHPEVNQESPPRLEPNNQILAPALERQHPFALELGGNSARLEWPHESRIADFDPVEATADEVRLELEPDRLDLRQLRHS